MGEDYVPKNWDCKGQMKYEEGSLILSIDRMFELVRC
jgi:hypothetical protein